MTSFSFLCITRELICSMIHELTRYDKIKTVKRMAVNSLAREVENGEETSDISFLLGKGNEGET